MITFTVPEDKTIHIGEIVKTYEAGRFAKYLVHDYNTTSAVKTRFVFWPQIVCQLA